MFTLIFAGIVAGPILVLLGAVASFITWGSRFKFDEAAPKTAAAENAPYSETAAPTGVSPKQKIVTYIIPVILFLVRSFRSGSKNIGKPYSACFCRSAPSSCLSSLLRCIIHLLH